MKNVKSATIVRTIILALSIVNNALAIAGKSPLPISDNQVSEAVAFCITTAAALVNWWKNNSFTSEAIAADEFMAQLKGKK
jgi:SPP1 family holin